MFPVIHDAALFENGGNGTIVETRWENYEGLSIHHPKSPCSKLRRGFSNQSFFFGGGPGGFKHHLGQTQ